MNNRDVLGKISNIFFLGLQNVGCKPQFICKILTFFSCCAIAIFFIETDWMLNVFQLVEFYLGIVSTKLLNQIIQHKLWMAALVVMWRELICFSFFTTTMKRCQMPLFFDSNPNPNPLHRSIFSDIATVIWMSTHLF